MMTLRMMIAAILATWAIVTPLRADEAAICAAQSTIEQQMQAFLDGDQAAAYSHAAPNIKQVFPTSDAFMAMVRNGYPPVHSPRNYAFGKAEADGGRIVQEVLILGPDGKDYEARYTLELQEDGVYRITGVSLRAADTLST